MQMSDRKSIVQMSPLQYFLCRAPCRPRQDATLGGCPCRLYLNLPLVVLKLEAAAEGTINRKLTAHGVESKQMRVGIIHFKHPHFNSPV